MILAKPTMHDLLYLCAQARPDEIEQYEALFGKPWVVDQVANEHFNKGGVKLVLVGDDNLPVAAAGWEQINPTTWNGWMVGTMDNWREHWLPITRRCRRVMDEMLSDVANRLEITALASREKTCDWYARGLKMKMEGIRRGFGVNGEDAVLYARVKEVGRGK